MTLGATRGSIARLIVGDGIRLAPTGVGVGLAGAVVATRLISERALRRIVARPVLVRSGAAVLLVVTIVACLSPMLRATAVDPATAIRAE